MSLAGSVLSPKANGNVAVDVQSSDIFNPPSRTNMHTSSKSHNDNMGMTPDELFTKFTVVEVKAFQTRLKADADAKQEELRLMVGERYRDLLQASSAIIAISKSSKRVLEAIEDSKDAILSQDDLPLPPQSTAISGINDKHLTNLQVLSTHIKLLLDTPEHLWRLIERKNYLHAAWLFSLSRVAHRTLTTHGEVKQFWAEEGLEVDADFPLVQRQWEVVAQFRSQIIHKSTLSLRDTSMSTEDSCAALTSLYLLDSRPLNEILSTFLLQRSKRLQAVLSWQLKPTDASPIVTTYPGASRSVPVREVTQVMKDVLNTIVQTVCTSRAIFQARPEVSSLLLRVLESIQSESDDNRLLSRLPANLHISTPAILGLLTSSASFHLLPPDVRSYRPYVDLGACSASLAQPVFFQKLQDWFRASCKRWETSSTKWLSGLNGVKEVWILRTSIKRLITTSHLSEEEQGYLSSNMDNLCHDQIVDIWKNKLSHAKDEFKLRLRSQISEDAVSNQRLSTSDFLFTPTPIPPLSQNRSSVDTTFQKYQLALKRQLIGRSPQLDSVLSILEDCARTIQNEFLAIKGFEDEDIRPFIERLEQTYQPAANDLSRRVAEIIEELTNSLIKPPDSNSHGLVFLSRAVDSLVSPSSFIHRIRCSNEATKDFKEKTSSIGDKALEEWRNVTVKRIVDEAKHRLSSQIFRASGPSHALLHSLLALAEVLRSLGILYHPVRQRAIVEDVFRLFVSSLLDGNLDNMDETTLHDLAFLRALSKSYGPSWNDIFSQINQRLKSVPPDKLDEVISLASDHLVRSQTLLSILLPTPTIPNFDAPLLQFGIPAAGQNFTSTADLAKPSSRFGMLLVGKTSDC